MGYTVRAMAVAAALVFGVGPAVADVNVSTLAGDGPTTNIVAGTYNSYTFYDPNDADVDAQGNVYVADFRHWQIRKVTPSGQVSLVAGFGLPVNLPQSLDGPAASARFPWPGGIAVADNGDLYVCDVGYSDSHKIRKISNGVVTTLAGGIRGFADGQGGMAKFDSDTCRIDADAAGNVYIADTDNNAIRKVTPSGYMSTLAGNGTAGSGDGQGQAAQFNAPISLVVDPAGNVFVMDGNASIRKVSPSGQVTTLFTNVIGGTDIDFDNAGNFYVIDAGRQIRRIAPNGQSTVLAGNLGPPQVVVDGHVSVARFYFMLGLAMDRPRNILYPVDTYGWRIRKVVEASTLKVCKVAGDGVAQDSVYQFDVRVGDTLMTTLSVPAGPAPGGYCVLGPTYGPGTEVVVTERPALAAVVSAITVRPAANQIAASLGTRAAKVRLTPGFTEVIFTNGKFEVGPPKAMIDDPNYDKRAYLEICKTGGARGGKYAFTVSGVAQPVVVPNGACSPPVRVPAGQVVVTEAPVANYTVSGCSALPVERLVSCDLTGRSAVVTTVSGGVAAQTVVTFVNKGKVVVIDAGGPKK